jgi:transcriptional regulator with XRE-family HTH domain
MGSVGTVESFGRRVAKRRADLGWTQRALAERLGVSRVALSHIEAAMTWPNERTVTLLAGIFRVEPHELVAGTDYPAAKVDRLPLVAARYTEVEHQLALLAADLRWLGAMSASVGGVGAGTTTATTAAARREVVAGWRSRLTNLLAASFDPEERRQVRRALTELVAEDAVRGRPGR